MLGDRNVARQLRERVRITRTSGSRSARCARPYQVHPHIVASGRALDQFSFPSGHTLHAVGFSGIALACYPELAPLLLPFTVLVALSRPILGLRYPSDVVAGAVLGGLIAGLSFCP